MKVYPAWNLATSEHIYWRSQIPSRYFDLAAKHDCPFVKCQTTFCPLDQSAYSDFDLFSNWFLRARQFLMCHQNLKVLAYLKHLGQEGRSNWIGVAKTGLQANTRILILFLLIIVGSLPNTQPSVSQRLVG